MVRCIVYLNRPLEYHRYLRLQENLRKHKKELILFCEHEPIITGGINFSETSLVTNLEALEELNLTPVITGRGGDVTAHEPGQIVIYPHIDIGRRKIQISYFFETLIRITSDNLFRIWGIESSFNKTNPGLYCMGDGKKIASIGITFKSFFTGHGIAVNFENSLETFRHILPCGLKQMEMTSVLRIKNRAVRKNDFIRSWAEDFQNYLTAPPPLHMH
ncbi:MAG: lipoyl(octanoyl) transferase LipB [Spirochaetia bacterium]|nr:lipoyl(octanoyl) transferase LipB [Spirochaetia bacterium]